jgi:hypothetical protein
MLIPHKKKAAIQLRAPAMSTGCQGTSLIQSPEVLQSIAQRKIAPCPKVWGLLVRAYFMLFIIPKWCLEGNQDPQNLSA